MFKISPLPRVVFQRTNGEINMETKTGDVIDLSNVIVGISNESFSSCGPGDCSPVNICGPDDD